MLEIQDHADGIVIAVRASPGAKRDRVVGVHGTALKVAVRAPPTDGRANEALVQVLRNLFGVKRGDVALVSGPTSRDKRFLIRGRSRQEVLEALAEWLG